ncbi:MAG: hypothetical protein JOY59_10695 [Candidatus Eremiobacteraeota bacterium]|nr:hypothetical protein [Candidatus Eremiobacteraeota bacterium]
MRAKHQAALLGAILALSMTSGPFNASAASGDAKPADLQWDVAAAQIPSDCDRELVAAKGRYDRVLAERGRSFELTVVPLAEADQDVRDRLAADIFLRQVAVDPAVRRAATACQVRVSAFFAEQRARPEVYAALAAAQAGKTAKSDADKRLVDDYVTLSRRSGAGLGPSERREFIALSKRLSEDGTNFSRNLAEDDTTIPLGVDRTAGLSPEFLATLKRADAGYVLPVNESTAAVVMRYAREPEVRKAFYFAYERRAATRSLWICDGTSRRRKFQATATASWPRPRTDTTASSRGVGEASSRRSSRW